MATLTGDNGLLQKATTSKEKNEEAGICENIKLAYGEWQIAQHTGTDKTAEEIIENKLKSTYGNNITNVKAKDEKVILKMTVKGTPKIYIFKSNTEEFYEYIDLFNYGEKTIETVQPGDDITLGTEKFRIFSKTDTEIKALPFYDLKLDANPMRQATKQEANENVEGVSKFSTTNYWTQGDDAINMNDSRNIIQGYINEYKKSLEKFGAKVEVRAAKYSELNAAGITSSMRSPERTLGYWIGSSDAGGATGVMYVGAPGSFCNGGMISYTYNYGVRPIIEIPI